MEEIKKEKKFNKNLILILVLSLVIVILVALTAWQFVENKKDKDDLDKKYNDLLEKVEEQDNKENEAEDTDIEVDKSDNKESTDEAEEEAVVEDTEEDSNDALEDDKGLMKVNWLNEPVRSEGEDENGVLVTDYKLGDITSGEYEGGEVRLEVYEELGIIYNRYILHKGQKILTAENDIKIKGIDDVPERVTYPNSDVELEKGYIGADLFSEENKIELGEKSFTDSGRDYYQTDEGCFVTELADGTLMPYDMKLPFLGSRDDEVDITIGNKKITDNYVYEKVVGCGALCSLLQDSTVTDAELVEAGYASNQDKIYELSNSKHKILEDIYNDENTLPYYDEENGKTEESKYSYEEFLALNPMLYWKDPLGNWIELKNSKVIVAAEMCKPVVYLYPEKETELKVEVSPNGGFTYTEPEYNGAWNVKASPSGEIIDLKTNESYEYLFWEGIGLNVGEMEKGFMVESNRIEKFLNEKLSYMGLNEKEISDFNEYWVERLNEEGYYKISFMDQRVFDEIAPLEVSPDKPDNIIRVFMIARHVGGPYSLEKQKLYKKGSRDGFSVVEWGGALLK
ncbi:MAG: hypothetical protein HQ538_02790 [Parcubacteria group bacterium]|nr:hypothetical protein [Parcubacteria group bacterium]